MKSDKKKLNVRLTENEKLLKKRIEAIPVKITVSDHFRCHGENGALFTCHFNIRKIRLMPIFNNKFKVLIRTNKYIEIKFFSVFQHFYILFNKP